MNVFIDIAIVFFYSLIVYSNGLHVTVDDISDLSDKDCGYSKQTNHLDSCLKWHQNYDIISQIRNGRPVTPGEMPWLALISFKEKVFWFLKSDAKCTAVVLSPYWLVTSGHCLHDEKGWSDDIRVFVGLRDVSDESNPLETDEVFVHPIWQHKQNSMFDLGLIKLKTPLDFAANNGIRNVNGICLPSFGVKNAEEEYALMAGFGGTGRSQKLSGFPRMGWTKIFKYELNKENSYGHAIISRQIPFPKGAFPCEGDSGGPLIQYANGRAVLIGIFSGYSKGLDFNVCLRDDDSQLIRIIRISYLMDWINETIRGKSN